MIRMSWVFEPIPIHDAAPMSAAGFAGVAIEAAILNYVIGHADTLVIDQHVDAGGSDPVNRISRQSCGRSTTYISGALVSEV
jgi:hypothetical protein